MTYLILGQYVTNIQGFDLAIYFKQIGNFTKQLIEYVEKKEYFTINVLKKKIV